MHIDTFYPNLSCLTFSTVERGMLAINIDKFKGLLYVQTKPAAV